MKHTISTTVVNTPTTAPASSDGIMMLVCHGIAIIGTLDLDTLYSGDTLASFTALGINEDYDMKNSLAVFQQINEFYEGGSNDGAFLYLLVTASSNPFATYVVGSTFKNAIRLTNETDPTKKVKMIGICYATPTTQQSAADFPTDVTDTITALQTTQEAMFEEGYQLSFILDGKNMSSTATSTSIINMATKESPSVSLCITGTIPNGVASVGLALGRFARITIGHGFGDTNDGSIASRGFLTNGNKNIVTATEIAVGDTLTAGVTYRVKVAPLTYNGTVYHFGETFLCVAAATVFSGTGAIAVIDAGSITLTSSKSYYVLKGTATYNGRDFGAGSSFSTISTAGQTATGAILMLDNSTEVRGMLASDVDNFGEKQYMFLRRWYDSPGVYWNDGGSCDVATKPLSTQEFNRVANRLSSDAVKLCIMLMGVAVPINPDGTVSKNFTGIKESEFTNFYLNPLILSGDISSGTFTLTGTRNGVASVDWTYLLNINGNPITGSVTGEVKFV